MRLQGRRVDSRQSGACGRAAGVFGPDNRGCRGRLRTDDESRCRGRVKGGCWLVCDCTHVGAYDCPHFLEDEDDWNLMLGNWKMKMLDEKEDLDVGVMGELAPRS